MNVAQISEATGLSNHVAREALNLAVCSGLLLKDIGTHNNFKYSLPNTE